MELKETVKSMVSNDYKERFRAEYFQTKIRYEKLKAFNTKIEASCRAGLLAVDYNLEQLDVNCPYEVLREQQKTMGEYLHLLELRAVFEKIELK